MGRLRLRPRVRQGIPHPPTRNKLAVTYPHLMSDTTILNLQLTAARYSNKLRHKLQLSNLSRILIDECPPITISRMYSILSVYLDRTLCKAITKISRRTGKGYTRFTLLVQPTSSNPLIQKLNESTQWNIKHLYAHSQKVLR